MRLSRVLRPEIRSPFVSPRSAGGTAGRCLSAGERLKLGRSGETQASTFGPPLPIVRPG